MANNIEDRGTEHSPADPNWRWQGVDTTVEKSPEAAARARQHQFATLEEFEKWRRSKGFPDLTFCELAWAFARFKGETPNETATLKPILEHR